MNKKQRDNIDELCRRLDALPIGSTGQGKDDVYISNPLPVYGDNDILLGTVLDDGDGWTFISLDA